MLGIPIDHVFANTILFDVSALICCCGAWEGATGHGYMPDGQAAERSTRMAHATHCMAPCSMATDSWPALMPLPVPPRCPYALTSSPCAARPLPAHILQHDGAYDGFDPEEFPSRSGGKAEAVQHIKQARGSGMQGSAGACAAWGRQPCQAAAVACNHGGCARGGRFARQPGRAAAALASYHPLSAPSCPAICFLLQKHNFKTVVMVGDGMTDFEARAPGGADAFIG